MPAWQDCTWRRRTCGKASCQVCGRMMALRQKHVDRGENPDSMEAALEDIEESFKEAKELLAKSAKKHNIDFSDNDGLEMSDPPKFNSYPLCRELMEWRNSVFSVIKKAEEDNAFWLKTEAAKDLAWYANLLPVKMHRLLTAKWEIENNNEWAKLDYDYTKYAVGEIISIVSRVFEGLRAIDADTDFSLLMPHSHFLQLLNKVKNF